MNYFITGIDTDSGKTLVSAIVCEALKADYWKPIQAGLPKDADMVKSLLSNNLTTIHPERHLLKMPASPHAAAKAENITIQLSDFETPTDKTLVIEGAGGCLVPINQHDFVIDLAVRFKSQVILVADLYLGSINHTLLTAQFLKQKNIQVLGIVFNGDSNPESESIILHHTGYKMLLHVNREKLLTKDIVKSYADTFNQSLYG